MNPFSIAFARCALICAALLGGTFTAIASSAGTTVSGRILDTQGGLPVPNATVELRTGTRVATARTDAAGNFRIPDVAGGTYVVLIRASGYESTRLAPDLLVSAEVAEV